MTVMALIFGMKNKDKEEKGGSITTSGLKLKTSNIKVAFISN